MNTKTDPRITDLEARFAVLHSRVMRLERLSGVSGAEFEMQQAAQRIREQRVASQPIPHPLDAAAAARTRPAEPASPPKPAPTRPHAPRPQVGTPDLEELLGGRVLAWIGGIAVVLGLAFFFALAISRGWIDEEARCVLGGAVAAGLLGAGLWLRERRGRNEAAMAAAAAGLAGLFLDVVVAARVYELIGTMPGVALAMVVGAAGTALALRWNAIVIGAIGTLGTVLAPVLAGASTDATTVALLWIATAAGAAVLVYKRWDLIAVALFVVSVPQWLGWVTETADRTQALTALVGFGGAGLVAACGFELRSGVERLRPSAAFLLAANSLVLAVSGFFAFGGAGHHQLADLWLVGLAIAHAVVGVSMRFDKRVSAELRTLCVAIAVVLADVAWGALVDGPAVGAGWALSAIGFAFALSRRPTESVERQAAMLGLGGQITIALVRALAVDAPVARIGHQVSPEAIFALVTLAAGCLISARFAEDGHRGIRALLDAAGLAVVAYLTACTLDGVALVAALAGEACALAAIARARQDEVARFGALGFLSIAALHTLGIEAPPRAFLFGTPHVLAMGGAVLAVTLATLRIAQSTATDHRMLVCMRAGAAATALFGASVAIVSAFQPSGEQGPMLLDLGVRQEGQMLVSALWSLTGAATLVIGLSRGKRELRLAGLGVLIASVAKVFLFDLATLTSIYRVLSFIALGLILLAGSYAWQRSRPAPLPDLRKA